MTIRLRPHHVLCSIGFDGKGYSDAFTANMANIVNGQLRAHDGRERTILIGKDADTICAPCPLRVGLGCTEQEKIDRLDASHGAALDLTPGEVLSWGACLDKVRARIVPDDLDVICAGCRWLPMGMCKAAVAELLEKAEKEERAAPDGTARAAG